MTPPPVLVKFPLIQSNRPGFEPTSDSMPAIGMITTFRALAQDVSKLDSYSEVDRLRLLQAIHQIENFWTKKTAITFREAILNAQESFSPEVRSVWRSFLKSYEHDYQSLQSVFLESNPKVLAERQFSLAQQFRKAHYMGASWMLTKLAERHPSIKKLSRKLREEIEGKRFEKEYLISDLFDQGGASIFLNMFGGFFGLWFTRKVQRFERYTAWVLSGPLHFFSTKGLMWATGYSGKIWPKSTLEWSGEFFSSYTQAGIGLFLGNRMFRIPVKKIKNIKIISAIPEISPSAIPNLPIPKKNLLWVGTKFAGKLVGLGSANIAAQLIPHYARLKPMTPPGYPERLGGWIFPKVKESRRSVAQLYDARQLYRQWIRTPEYQGIQKKERVQLVKKHEVSLFLTKLSPRLIGKKRLKVLSLLLKMEGEGKMNRQIRQLLLQYHRRGERWQANRWFEQQKIPLRLAPDGKILTSDLTEN